MKISQSKQLNKRIDTICDFTSGTIKGSLFETPTETDPTTATVTIIVTTINTHLVGQKLTA